MQRRYLNSKLRMSRNRNIKWSKRKSDHNSNRPQVDISNPIPIENSADENNVTDLERHSSYRDLREPLDEDIEIYVRNVKTNNELKTVSGKTDCNLEQSSYQEEESSYINKSDNSMMDENVIKEIFETVSTGCKKTIKEIRFSDINNVVDPAVINVNENMRHDKGDNENGISSNNNNNNEMDLNNESLKNVSVENKSTKSVDTAISSSKSRISIFSESMSEGWNKFSSLSRKFTGAMQEHVQKRKEQFRNFRPASEQDKEHGQKSNEKTNSSHIILISTEGYFVGDSRCNEENPHDSSQETGNICTDTQIEIVGEGSSKDSPTRSIHEEVNDPEPVHCEGDEPCPCFVCKTIGDGNILRRRRSSSVPPPDRKALYNLPSKVLLKQTSLTDCDSDSNADHVETNATVSDSTKHGDSTSKSPFVPKIYPKGRFPNLSLMSSGNRIEHYV
ncbi:uncharacterized protein TNIN_488441 [Trichonephila inaurata madagascariensis]|uniref:Uncharacterized protein n=1 Tax=Trichonephila inaurata madagascariensis TaxID=2747483 RepID=A0A8X6YGI4_9ARAC|nr:uncharacterized protein TNIN_488441 [Trichonephila inaurata madagascariensis]